MPVKMKIGYIYLVRNLVNGKGYIGKTSRTEEWKAHISASKKRSFAMKKENADAYIN